MFGGERAADLHDEGLGLLLRQGEDLLPRLRDPVGLAHDRHLVRLGAVVGQQDGCGPGVELARQPLELVLRRRDLFLLVELAVLEHPRVDGALGGRELGALEGREVTGLHHLAGRARHHPERFGQVLGSVLVDGVEQRREGRRVRLAVELGRHAEVGLADGGGLGVGVVVVAARAEHERGAAAERGQPDASRAAAPAGRRPARCGGRGTCHRSSPDRPRQRSSLPSCAGSTSASSSRSRSSRPSKGASTTGDGSACTVPDHRPGPENSITTRTRRGCPGTRCDVIGGNPEPRAGIGLRVGAGRRSGASGLDRGDAPGPPLDRQLGPGPHTELVVDVGEV